jgi:UDP-N-acetylmuramoyl-tripeptide--D-alanyl-D-alanine ligase
LISALGKNHYVTYNSRSIEIVEEEPTLTVCMEQLTVKTKLTGSYNNANIAAAYCVGMHFGVTPKDAASAITNYAPNNSRSQLRIQNGKTLALDAYNANPTSMQAAVTAFGKRSGKKAVILGHMAELGTYESAEHQSLVDLVASHEFDACYWVGRPYESIVATNYFSNVDELNVFLKNNPVEADQVLIKGSRSATLEKVLSHL